MALPSSELSLIEVPSATGPDTGMPAPLSTVVVIVGVTLVIVNGSQPGGAAAAVAL